VESGATVAEAGSTDAKAGAADVDKAGVYVITSRRDITKAAYNQVLEGEAIQDFEILVVSILAV
jgi:hypothetical protein